MKCKFVFVSKDLSFKMPREDMAGRNGIEALYFPENKKPLSVVYNEVLNSDIDSDFILLMHADVAFDVDGTLAHLESVKEKYDLIGLCGCAKFSVGQSPLNWYCGSIPFPGERWGCVTHGELGNQISFFSQHHPNETDHEVACIDGLCIVFTRKSIDAGLRFDETLSPFDFYDTDISCQAILKYGLKVGVIVRRELQHWSIGKSILTPEFLKNEDIFRTKWGFQRRR